MTIAGDSKDHGVEIVTGCEITFAGMLDRLGHRPDEMVSLCSDRDGTFRCVAWTYVKSAPRVVVPPPEHGTPGYTRANTFFSVNPVRAGLSSGRGKEQDTARLAVLVGDLDFADGKCGSLDVALNVAEDLAAVMGQPVVIVFSGHGLHPYWSVDDGTIGPGFTHEDAKALVTRFGALVAAIAGRHNVTVDGVFDLARVMRVPGTVNIKPGMAPVEAVCYEGTGKALTVAEVRARLDEAGIPEHPVKTTKKAASTTANGEQWSTQGKASPKVLARLALLFDHIHARSLRTGDGSRHGNVRDDVLALLALGKRGEPGVSGAITLARAQFIDQIGPDRPGGEVEAEREFDSFLDPARVEPLLDDDEPQGEGVDNLFDGEPIPLMSRVPVPAFPVDALPPQIANMVAAVAAATKTDPAMAGTVALTVLSACAGGVVEVMIRRDWIEPLNIYTATIANPGERKSAVLKLMATPLYEAERQLVEEGRDERLAADICKQVKLKAAEKLLQSAAMAAAGERKPKGDAVNPDESMDAAIAAGREAEAIVVPTPPRLVGDDVTPEVLASLLAEQGGRMAIISAEGGIFDIMAGRYANNGKANLDVWLKGHSGDELRVDRKGRSPEYIPHPALTICLTVQPAVLHTISANREFRGRGLLARFLYSWPAEMVGRRPRGEPPPVPSEVTAAYTAAVMILAKGMAALAGQRFTLRLTAEARRALQAIEDEVEPTLAAGGELATLPDWGGKYVGALARIAGVLHLASHSSVTTAFRAEVTEETVRDAARIGEFFKAGAINAFVGMGVDQVAADAAYLLERLAAEGRGEVSERDLLVMVSRARFHRKADLAPVVSRLVEHSFLAKLPTQSQAGTRGRPLSPRYKVHPTITKTTKTAKIGTEHNSVVSVVFVAGSKDFAGGAPNGQVQTAPEPSAHPQQSAERTAAPSAPDGSATVAISLHPWTPVRVSSGFAATSADTR